MEIRPDQYTLFYISEKILPPPETIADQADAAKGICK